MDSAEQLAWIRLLRTPNIGPMTFGLLLRRYGSAREALRAIPDLAKRGGRKLTPASVQEAEAELAANHAAGAQLIFMNSEAYPERLGQFDDAPPFLSMRGNLHLLHQLMIAIVGARNASINAMQLADHLAGQLSEAGYLVVSGMARGIDTAAHSGALAHGTMAVLASGVDIIYPPENADLYESLCDVGVVAAEMPPGTAPTPRLFPVRNRIIASLSLGVVVIEAAARSGSLITAREATERGSEVMAIPGSPLDPRSEGCNMLIRDGATLVQNKDDIIEAISGRPRVTMPPPPVLPALPTTPADEEAVARTREIIDAALSAEPTNIDEILRWHDASPATMQAALLELELAGKLLRHHGNRVSKRFAP